MSSSPLPSPRVPIHTCQGLFEKLKWEFEQLEKHGWDEYRTFNFAVTGWHLYNDWIEKAGTEEQKKRRNKILRDKKKFGADKIFSSLRDITNASKHWSLKPKHGNDQVVKDVSERMIGDFYAYFIAGPVIYIEIDEFRLSMPEIADATVDCMEWILNGNYSFPERLKEKLQILFKSKWTE